MRLSYRALFLMLLAGSACAQESYSAKSLFFGEDDSVVAVSTDSKNKDKASLANTQDSAKKTTTNVAYKKPATPQNIGASYFIRLKNPDGTTRDVLSSHKFKSGERFQLGVKVNRPSYVAIFNEDPSGNVKQIYPQPGHDNFVNAMGVVFLPAQGAFEFDQEPGIEQLLVHVSKTQIQAGMPERIKKMRPDVVTRLPDAAPLIAGASCAQPATPDKSPLPSDGRDYASKGINFTDASTCTDNASKGDSYASKGIAFTDDDTSGGAGGTQTASYVVKKATAPNTSLYLKIKLVHQ